MRKFLVTFIFSLLAPLCAVATPADDGVKKIEQHLNSITTMKADFTQISPDGGVASGKFFLARPGKLRWQYEPPVPLLIIGSHGQIQYHDLQLDTVSYVSMDDTLAGLMARSNISLSNSDIEVRDYKSEAGVIRLTVQKKSKPDDGALTLVLDENPMALRKLEVVDGARQTTVISLNQVVFNTPLDEKLFEFEKKGEGISG